MSDFKSEILPSGAELQISNEIYCISTTEHYVQVTKADIARMYGIAFPEKRRTGECCNIQSDPALDQAEPFDINSPVVYDLTEEQKRVLITGALDTVTPILLHVFYTCGLSNEIFTNIINQPTGEKFSLTFKKATEVDDINVADLTQPSDKYEQRVGSVAEEMAITKHPVSFKLYTKYSTNATASWSADFYRHNWPIIVDGYMDYARIAVAAQAEAIKKALNEFYGLEAHCDIGDDPESQVTEEQCARIKAHDIEVYLIQHGYVPSPEKKCETCGGALKNQGDDNCPKCWNTF